MNKHNHIQLSIRKIVELADIENYPNFLTMDYAVPMNADGKYPYQGKAVTIYYRDGDIIITPHTDLMSIALSAVNEKLFNPQSFVKLSKSKLYDLLLIKDLLESIYTYDAWEHIQARNSTLFRLRLEPCP